MRSCAYLVRRSLVSRSSPPSRRAFVFRRRIVDVSSSSKEEESSVAVEGVSEEDEQQAAEAQWVKKPNKSQLDEDLDAQEYEDERGLIEKEMKEIEQLERVRFAPQSRSSKSSSWSDVPTSIDDLLTPQNTETSFDTLPKLRGRQDFPVSVVLEFIAIDCKELMRDRW